MKQSIKQNGVTLIEVLITVAVMLILLGVAFWGYEERRGELKLQQAALELSSDIEKAREMAISARIEGPERPEGGFGVYLDKNSGIYIIFADVNADKEYNAGLDSIKDEADLKQGITFTTILPADITNIIFIPPSPDVYINTAKDINAEIIIALETDSSKTKKIIVNPAGLISIED